MEKTRIMSGSKKCLCCGKMYSPYTELVRCTCKNNGLLIAAGTWHQPKVKGSGVNGD